jgi:hypothetical protein
MAFNCVKVINVIVQLNDLLQRCFNYAPELGASIMLEGRGKKSEYQTKKEAVKVAPRQNHQESSPAAFR